MKKVLAVIIAVIVAFCAGYVVGAFGLIQFGGDKITVKVLKEEVEQVADLASLKCVSTETGEIKNSKQIAKKYDIPLTGKQLTAECNVITILGSDLGDADFEISEDQTEVTVKVPKSKIISQQIDEESWTLVNNKSGLFNRTTVEDDDQIRKDVKKAATKRLKENNYYEEANEVTENVLVDLFSKAHPDVKVTVEFK